MPDESPDDYLDDFLSSAFAPVGSSVDSEIALAPGPARAEEEAIPASIGAYEILECVGSGGVGTVYRATDPSLGREVAIKILRSRYLADPPTVERFVSEARLCAQLTHPGVVSVHEVGALEDGRPFFAMRLIEGETLAERIRSVRGGDDSIGSTLLVEFESLCGTLASVHEQGVVHGDLKPHNVMVGPFGEVQLMDWGFARRLDAQEEVRRGGTPAYMAPEQASGATDPITVRTDVFGLGAILCEILTGSPPYQGRDEADVLLQSRRGFGRADLDERLLASGHDAALVELVQSCLAVDPGERPADAGVVAAKLRAIAVAREQGRRALEIDAAESRARVVQERRARKLTIALAASILIGGAVAAMAWLSAQREADARRTHASRIVDRALQDLAQARGETIDPEASARAWSRVRDAAARLRVTAQDESLDAESRTAALAAAEAAETESDAAARRIEFFLELADLRPHFGEDRAPPDLDASYTTAFANAGIDFEQPLERIVATVQESPIRDSLVDALDRWALFRRKSRVPTGEAWRDVVEVASRVDEDPWRIQLRDSVTKGDRSALLAMAADVRAAESWTQSASSLDFLADSLVLFGQRRAAIELYRQAVLQFPEDYVLTHHLAVVLEFEREPPREEILRLAWAGVALRPNDTHALIDLGRELAIAGKRADAMRLLSRALAIHESPRGLLLRGNLLAEAGDNEAAEADFARLEALGHRAGAPMRGLILTRMARLDEAVECLRTATEREPDEATNFLHYGRVLCKRSGPGDTEAGLAALDRAIELDPSLAEAHCNRAEALRWLGRFDEGLEAARRGHELGSSRESWPYPSEYWLVLSEGLARAAAEYDEHRHLLEASAAEGSSPATAPLDALAMVALRRRDDPLAWRLWRAVRERVLEDAAETWIAEERVWIEFAIAGARVLGDAAPDAEGVRGDMIDVLDALEQWSFLEADRVDRLALEQASDGVVPIERGSESLFRFRYDPDLTAFGARLERTTFALPDGRDAWTVWRELVAEVTRLIEGT